MQKSQGTRPQYRAAHQKTKTGCRTCKIRRVKCDEARPACVRCCSTGRVCDGYVEIGATRGWFVVTGPRPIVPTFQIEDDTSRLHFEFFRTVSVSELSRFSSHSFWCRSLLCATQQFPAVLSAVLAVASLHRCFKQPHCVSQNSPMPNDQPTSQALVDLFAVRHYGEALRQLIRGKSGVDRYQERLVTLICGVLFTIIEVLQGYNEKALVHLDGIIRLVKERQPATTLVTDMEKDLQSVISRLDVEAALFSTRRPPGFMLPMPSLEDVQPRTFELDQTADELNSLIAHMSHFKRVQTDTFRYETVGDIPLPVVHSQQQLAEHFCRWWDLATPLFATANREHVRQIALMQVHYHTSWTILQCCLHAEETAYDRYSDQFADIVRWSAVIADSESATMSPRTFSADLGIIFPLYWTALRCRDGRLRRAALAQLRVCAREGVWIPEIHTCVARRAIEIEEGLEPGSLGLQATAESLPSYADIFEDRRIHCVGLDVDNANCKVRMTYHRRLNGLDGEWNIEQEWLYY